MTYEEYMDDLIIHKKLILDACLPLVHFLAHENRKKEATRLFKRCVIHDESKLSKMEMEKFLELNSEKQNMKNAQEQIPDHAKDAVACHWTHNRHHPEHFEDYHQMTTMDRMEMVCDWYARSMQYDTDFLEFVKTRQKNRFRFDDEFFNEIYKYCEIVADGGKK